MIFKLLLFIVFSYSFDSAQSKPIPSIPSKPNPIQLKFNPIRHRIPFDFHAYPIRLSGFSYFFFDCRSSSHLIILVVSTGYVIRNSKRFESAFTATFFSFLFFIFYFLFFCFHFSSLASVIVVDSIRSLLTTNLDIPILANICCFLAYITASAICFLCFCV